ncbi:hypothetical protein StoSoilB3_31750 [Arthrobacter sp. StoSoilB3]|nr:hypothetical protein StoSoilB3_31750 [Arthrobacter sp. StoSoilB3]
MKVRVNDHRIGTYEASVPDLDGPSCNYRGTAYAAILANPDFGLRMNGSKNSRVVDANDLKPCPGYSYKIFADANFRTCTTRYNWKTDEAGILEADHSLSSKHINYSPRQCRNYNVLHKISS